MQAEYREPTVRTLQEQVESLINELVNENAALKAGLRTTIRAYDRHENEEIRRIVSSAHKTLSRANLLGPTPDQLKEIRSLFGRIQHTEKSPQ